MKDVNQMSIEEIMKYVATGAEVIINDGKATLEMKHEEGTEEE